MITEDYVSFGIAKLLKEKGFDSEDIGRLGGLLDGKMSSSKNPSIRR